ncbi:hypothetical protein EON80_09290 [bacterium]|nr:MAG: hypothetical protein EON80_09290 [bacterium]
MSDSFRRWPLFASLIAYFVLTLALIFVVPTGDKPNLDANNAVFSPKLYRSPPDEAAHLRYVQYLAANGKLPVFNGLPPSQSQDYEFHQPPLYYVICAPLAKIFGAETLFHACRFVSMLASLATIWVIWAASRLLFPSNWRIAGVAAGFAALLPLHQAAGAGVNNDSLGGLICALLFWLMARVWIVGPTWREVGQIGLVAGVGILTKNTTLSVAAATFLVLLWATSQSQDEKAPRPVLAFGAAFAIAMLVGGSILIRNQFLYGDVLAQKIFSAAFKGESFGPTEFARFGIGPFIYLRNLVFVAFCSLWGFFGGANGAGDATHLFGGGPTLPNPALFLPMLICGLAPVVALLGWRILRAEDGLEASPKAVRSSWVLGIAFVGLAWAQFAAQYFAGGQARYGHPALLPVCIFLAAGWVGFWGKARALTVASSFFAVVLIGLTLLNVFVWKNLS